MSDPLLSSLCRICHTNPPKYRCPRCALQTCSLPCTKRHKLWSDCSGIRDPTAYKSRAQLATPAGIDHDYNFISAIERSIERSERVIVEEKCLLDRKELRPTEMDERRRRRRGFRGPLQGQDFNQPLGRAMQSIGVIVDRAPKGMARNVGNTTNWSKHEKCINWTIEWITDDGNKSLGKGLDKHSIGRIYGRFLDEEERNRMTAEEKRSSKKRRAEDVKEEKARKRTKLMEGGNLSFGQPALLQNPQSTAWNLESDQANHDGNLANRRSTFSDNLATHERVSKLSFYLHRPFTSAKHPKVLIPLPPFDSLDTLLYNRVVLEFPTIYVLPFAANALPAGYMLEEDYLAGTKPRLLKKDLQNEDTDEDEPEDGGSSDDDESDTSNEDSTSEDENGDDDTSSAGSSSSDSEVEEGEIL